MSFNVNSNIFANRDIREALEKLSKVGSRRKLGVERWDHVLDVYQFSGTVVVPVKVANRVFREPFYFVVEKIGAYESLRIRPVEGEQWSIGDVFGFFGMYDFKDYVYGQPILVVEGLSDWAVVKEYYKYTLASLTAWLSLRQRFILSGLTSVLYLGYDLDEAGANSIKKLNDSLTEDFGIVVGQVKPAMKDWGKMYEDPFARDFIPKIMGTFQASVDKIINKTL